MIRYIAFQEINKIDLFDHWRASHTYIILVSIYEAQFVIDKGLSFTSTSLLDINQNNLEV